MGRRPMVRRPITSDPGGPEGPARTCIGCRRRAGQHDLVRLVRRADGSLVVDRHGPGRGAWLCAGSLESCAREARRRKAYTRAFRTPVDGPAIDRFVALFGSSGPDMADLLAADRHPVDSNHLKG